MAVTYQSISTAAIGDADLVIAKPTGLAVGDTMLAGIYWSDDAAGTSGVVTPTGWTLELRQDNSGESLSVYSKLADSGDVAASDFTFTMTGGDTSYHFIGHILRISEFGLIVGESSAQDTNNGTATVVASGFTPTRANTLFVAFLSQSRTGGTPEVVSVATATDNPSWTERAETQFNDSTYDSVLGTFTAIRAETTATGNVTGTLNGAAVGVKMIAFVSISSQLNGEVEPVTVLNAYALNPIDTDTYATAYVEDPATDIGNFTSWQNESKPSTDWQNEQL
jgi:hypothetical protein